MKEAKKMSMSRRTFTKAAGAAVAAGAMAVAGTACSSGSEASSASSASGSAAAESADGLTPLTIGYWGGSPCELPMYVALEQGYWQQAGIEPNITLITQDVSILLANEEIDVDRKSVV